MKNEANSYDIIIIGGGASGFFAAIAAAEVNNQLKICIIEKQVRFLSKVLVSGGGRCNVTHDLNDNTQFVKNYPRGEKELPSIFSRWGQKETVQWFLKQGIRLHSEADGRMFPISNKSETIANCLIYRAKQLGVELFLQEQIESIDYNIIYNIKTNKRNIQSEKIILCCGGFPKKQQYEFIEKLGHQIIEPIPSLFTFNIENEGLRNLSGISVPNGKIKLEGNKLSIENPVLITHKGISGPAVLKASAFWAKLLFEKNYHFNIYINWGEFYHTEDAFQYMISFQSIKKNIGNTKFKYIPQRLFHWFLFLSDINPNLNWNDIPKKKIIQLAEYFCNHKFEVSGKSTHKEEFVTCGGINLKEINIKKMESKLLPNLYFAGELINIDGITGGFNFQAAWSTGRIAGESAAQKLS